jgi:hypothetical protein
LNPPPLTFLSTEKEAFDALDALGCIVIFPTPPLAIFGNVNAKLDALAI